MNREQARALDQLIRVEVLRLRADCASAGLSEVQTDRLLAAMLTRVKS